ncbi:MAG: NAD(P)/FAD-dependent oxidoreductase, partial [Bacilli bacterium]|nr:NAD(P)/FAD-dependent oxidoreductase [Bacilli bacterium]
MKIGIIGASAAGLYTALLYLRRCPKSEVIIYDHADKVGKKLLATGNGHCNLMHLPFSEKAFNHPDFVR